MVVAWLCHVEWLAFWAPCSSLQIQNIPLGKPAKWLEKVLVRSFFHFCRSSVALRVTKECGVSTLYRFVEIRQMLRMFWVSISLNEGYFLVTVRKESVLKNRSSQGFQTTLPSSVSPKSPMATTAFSKLYANAGSIFFNVPIMDELKHKKADVGTGYLLWPRSQRRVAGEPTTQKLQNGTHCRLCQVWAPSIVTMGSHVLGLLKNFSSWVVITLLSIPQCSLLSSLPQVTWHSLTLSQSSGVRLPVCASHDATLHALLLVVGCMWLGVAAPHGGHPSLMQKCTTLKKTGLWCLPWLCIVWFVASTRKISCAQARYVLYLFVSASLFSYHILTEFCRFKLSLVIVTQFCSSASSMEIRLCLQLLFNRWEMIAPLPNGREDCVGVALSNLFYIIAGVVENHADQRTVEIYDPLRGTWYSLHDLWLFSRQMPCPVTSMHGHMYALDDWDANTIKMYDPQVAAWVSVGPVPGVEVPGQIRKPKGFNFGLIGLRNELYVLGGKVLRWQPANGHWKKFDILRLNTVIACNPSIKDDNVPWRRVKSMGDSRGAVLGCAVLEEESRKDSSKPSSSICQWPGLLSPLPHLLRTFNPVNVEESLAPDELIAVLFSPRVFTKIVICFLG